MNDRILKMTAALLAATLAASGWCRDVELDVRPGPGVTQVKKISDYFAPLAGTHLDTGVYVLDSGKPGATALLIGGTHGNELAGSTAALVALENIVVNSGKLIVMPHTNRSGASMADTRNSIEHRLPIKSRSGERFLTYGDRRTDPDDQGAGDPDEYLNPGGYLLKNGAESRNLNRTYPGKPDGTRTEQLAWAIIQLVKQENVDFTLDMHEAGTPDRDEINDDYETGINKRLSYTLVTHPDGLETAAFALLAMEADTGISMKLEESNSSYRGLSHLEIGDNTGAVSFLSESPNPGQDRWRDEHDVVTDASYPLKHRVGMHLRLFKHLADAYADETGKVLAMDKLPEYDDMMAGEIGDFLN